MAFVSRSLVNGTSGAKGCTVCKGVATTECDNNIRFTQKVPVYNRLTERIGFRPDLRLGVKPFGCSCVYSAMVYRILIPMSNHSYIDIVIGSKN